MKKLLTFFALLAMFAFAGCDNYEEPITQQTSALTLSFQFNTINTGESMTKTLSNSEIFAEFYAAICDGRLVAPSYNLTFTEVNTGESFQLKGKWNVRTEAKIKMGTYKVTGTATAEGEYIQDKCSIVINEPSVVIDRDEANITLKAEYDCALVIFNDESIASVVNHTGASEQKLFEFSPYLYAFVNNSIWDGVSESYMLGTRHNSSQFTIPTNTQLFRKGEYYIYDTTKTNSFESGFILPEMEEGEIFSPQPANEIWYTSTDGNIVEPHNSSRFGANIVSNTYKNGKGVIKFDRDVTDLYYAFQNCSSLTSVTIPEGVTKISSNAFDGCTSLTNVTIPKSVTEIGWMAFNNCDSLTSIAIPDSVTSIGVRAFRSCDSLTNITIPEGITEIKTEAFAYCDNISNATIPQSLICVESGVFSRCENLYKFSGWHTSEDGRCLILDGNLVSFAPAGLTEYTIPQGVTSIGTSTFDECRNLTNITLPQSITSIGVCAFLGCSSLASITIPDGVISIGTRAFYGCSSLSSITIPESVTEIGRGVFERCSHLMEFKGKFASEDGCCLIVNGVLCGVALAYWSYPTQCEYTIPESVLVIGSFAFYEANRLHSITIHEGVTSIENNAFDYCIRLTSVYCKPTTPPAASIVSNSWWGAFDDNSDNRKIYVPTESVDAYKTAEGWSEYAEYIEPYDFE